MKYFLLIKIPGNEVGVLSHIRVVTQKKDPLIAFASKELGEYYVRQMNTKDELYILAEDELVKENLGEIVNTIFLFKNRDEMAELHENTEVYDYDKNILEYKIKLSRKTHGTPTPYTQK